MTEQIIEQHLIDGSIAHDKGLPEIAAQLHLTENSSGLWNPVLMTDLGNRCNSHLATGCGDLIPHELFRKEILS